MKIVKDFILRDIAGESVLVPTGKASEEFNGMITMTDTARFIWERLEKLGSLDELVNAVTETYDVDEETARRDCVGLINALLKRGIVTFSKEDHTW